MNFKSLTREMKIDKIKTKIKNKKVILKEKNGEYKLSQKEQNKIKDFKEEIKKDIYLKEEEIGKRKIISWKGKKGVYKLKFKLRNEFEFIIKKNSLKKIKKAFKILTADFETKIKKIKYTEKEKNKVKGYILVNKGKFIEHYNLSEEKIEFEVELEIII